MTVKLTNHPQLRTIRFVASGILTEEDVQKAADDARAMTTAYAGKKHMVLADLRGLKPASPKVAQKLGELIAYQRANGVSLCVHLSDETVTRLQVDRLSRQASPHDKMTFDVVSIEEAEAVLSEARLKLRNE
jgi:hypothetical protein